jgi:tetratricopeptide (TPR) repeat protein
MAAPSSADVEKILRLGFARLQAHLLNHAEATFRQALAAAPENPAALRLLGVTLFKMGRRDEALSRLRAACETAPDNPAVWSDLAVALREGDPQAAAEAYERAASLAPALPPLAQQAFSSERATHDFTLVDYDYKARIRYGAGRPPHPQLHGLIAAGRERYKTFLTELGGLHADFAKIPMGGRYEDPDPFWLNAWFPPLDAMALTGLLRKFDPDRFVEIGSGVSTKFAQRAARLYGLRTKLISIDPQPRNEIDALCDQVIRRPLEDCRPEMFDVLAPGDVLFLDSSHRAFQGSDVTVFFLEILPRLKPGVIVHIHDVYLPDDYIAGHVPRLWNEQYLLATALLFAPGAFEILFPAWFVGQDPEVRAHAEDALRHGPLADLELYGASFWMRKA